MIHQFNDSGAEVLVIVRHVRRQAGRGDPQDRHPTVVLAGVPEFFPKIPETIVRGVQKVWSRTLPPVPSLEVPVLRLREALAKGRAHRAMCPAWWEGHRNPTIWRCCNIPAAPRAWPRARC
jgi:long-chain acyl-CoA synthetase